MEVTKDVIVNLNEKSSMWTDVAWGCKAMFFVVASVFLVACTVYVVKRIKQEFGA